MLQEGTTKPARLRVNTLLKDFRLDNQPTVEDLPREIAEILCYINESIFDPHLTVRTLKIHCRIRDNNASSRFRYFMGLTIKEYIEELRLEAAALLLRESTICILEVAASIGYYHLQTFYRVFQRKHGCTPAEYRKALGPADASASADESPSGTLKGPLFSRQSVLGWILASQVMGPLAELIAL